MILGCLDGLLSQKGGEGLVPDLPKVVIYEVNLRALGPKVGFNSLTNRLGKIKALGVNILWLMPVQPVGKLRSAGGLGSPYAVEDYDSVNPEFGSEADFRRLVSTAHKMKLGLIIDWAADHTSWDSKWIRAHPTWYVHDDSGISIPSGTKWKDVAALNYANPSMRAAMIASMKGWITRFDVDGFRCDASDRMPFDFWKDAIRALKVSTSKRLLMLAEGFRTDDYKAGFDLTYGWEFCSGLREVFKGKSAKGIAASAAREAKDLPSGARRLRFITNHDISAWEGTLTDFYNTPQGARTAFAVTALYGGTPLIYMGQEVNWNKRIPMFEQSAIDWNAHPESARWMTELLHLRSQHAVLQTGNLKDFSTDDVVCFSRTYGSDEALVLANVRDRSNTPSIPEALLGNWKVGLKGGSMNVKARMILPPYGCLVLLRSRSLWGLRASTSPLSYE